MRLPIAFAVEEDAEEPVTLRRQSPERYRQSWPAHQPWTPPQGQDFFHRLVEVGNPNEKTCLGCGETFIGKICDRCGLLGPGEDGAKVRRELPPAVLTTSYLRPEEYRVVGK